MQQLLVVDPIYLDRVWGDVAPILEKAVAKNKGEINIDQLRLHLVSRNAYLLVGVEDDKIFGAATIEFINHANYRVAFITYIAGITSQELFEQLKEWCRSMGASKIEGYGTDAIVRLWHRYGFDKAYNVVRVDL